MHATGGAARRRRPQGRRSSGGSALQPSLLQSLGRPGDAKELPAWAARIRERLQVVEKQLRRLEDEKQMLLDRLIDAPVGIANAVLAPESPTAAWEHQGSSGAMPSREEVLDAEFQSLWTASASCGTRDLLRRWQDGHSGANLHPRLTTEAPSHVSSRLFAQEVKPHADATEAAAVLVASPVRRRSLVQETPAGQPPETLLAAHLAAAPSALRERLEARASEVGASIVAPTEGQLDSSLPPVSAAQSEASEGLSRADRSAATVTSPRAHPARDQPGFAAALVEPVLHVRTQGSSVAAGSSGTVQTFWPPRPAAPLESLSPTCVQKARHGSPAAAGGPHHQTPLPDVPLADPRFAGPREEVLAAVTPEVADAPFSSSEAALAEATPEPADGSQSQRSLAAVTPEVLAAMSPGLPHSDHSAVPPSPDRRSSNAAAHHAVAFAPSVASCQATARQVSCLPGSPSMCGVQVLFVGASPSSSSRRSSAGSSRLGGCMEESHSRVPEAMLAHECGTKHHQASASSLSLLKEGDSSELRCVNPPLLQSAPSPQTTVSSGITAAEIVQASPQVWGSPPHGSDGVSGCAASDARVTAPQTLRGGDANLPRSPPHAYAAAFTESPLRRAQGEEANFPPWGSPPAGRSSGQRERSPSVARTVLVSSEDEASVAQNDPRGSAAFEVVTGSCSGLLQRICDRRSRASLAAPQAAPGAETSAAAPTVAASSACGSPGGSRSSGARSLRACSAGDECLAVRREELGGPGQVVEGGIPRFDASLLSKDELARWMIFFGLKPTGSRDFMVQKLQEIDAYLHHGTGAGEGERVPNSGVVGPRKGSQHGRQLPMRTLSCEQSSAERGEGVKRGAKRARDDLPARRPKPEECDALLAETIRGDKALYERLLVFEPVEITEIRERLSTMRPDLRFSENAVRAFLDKQGLVFQESQASQPGPRRRY